MTRSITHKPDPKLDLVLERVVDVPPDLVWAAWTRPDYVKKWFTPAPWQTVECEIDLRSGGILPDRNALAGGTGIPEYRLLPRK